ncbi:MAG: EamA family transporter [Elusimicrobiales bacterium]|jgi:drug/metabolite transporter (DMT)-like permease|nr:EamA family transporter [Elusimicrobiales bacterium]NLH40076.1 EamA family transporter [Elusimicrobiota bacterium]
MDKKKSFWIYAGLFYCSFIWGSTFIVTKYGLNYVSSSAMVSIRFFISAAALLPWVAGKKNIFTNLKEPLILSIFLSSLYLSQTLGLVYTTASNSGFITGLFIIFIPVFNFFINRKKPKKIEAISSLIAISGLWLLTDGVKEINYGDVLTLVAAMSYSLHILYSDKFIKSGYDILNLSFHQFWMVGVISAVAVILSGESFYVSTPAGWMIIIFLALFPTLSAFFIQMTAQKYADPFKVGIIFTLEPVFSAIFAWTVGGEKIILLKAIGGFLIFFSMIAVEVDEIVFRRNKS